MKTKRKLLLIGWDGADWKVINPLIEKGLLPNLEKLVNQGCMGNLATLDPPFSPMLWTSIATGKRPYKHGVMGFNEPDPDGVNVRPVLSISRKCKAIWNILTQKNYKTHTAGWWPSHPAEPINGISLSNFFQRPLKGKPENWTVAPQSVHPANLSDHFAKLRIHPSQITGNHILPFIPLADKLTKNEFKHVHQLRQLIAENSTLHAAFTNILRTQEWDFASIYFDGIDRTCHEFMKYHPPKRAHIPQHEFDVYKDVVAGMYQYHDMMLGRAMELAGEDATIMLISDHGFQPDHLRPKNTSLEPAGIAFEHSPYGIFCIKGPGIKKDSLIHGASILDITPTILHLFDLPQGQDMDGIPLLNIFEEPKIPTSISSWEDIEGNAGMPNADLIDDPNFAEEMLNQLVALGYIDQPNKDKKQAYNNAKAFCDTNMARAYLDASKVVEATALFEQLFDKNKKTPWITYRLAICYQMLGDKTKCRALIQLLKTGDFYQPAILDTMEATLLMGEGKYQEAANLLEKTEAAVDVSLGDIHLKIARCYAMIGKKEEARKAIEKELVNNYDNPFAHEFLGIMNLNSNRFEAAVDCFLNAIGLEYSLAEAHYYLGKTFMALGKYEESADAFEVCLGMKPENNHARQLLNAVYKTHLNKPEEASRVSQDFNKYLQGTITIVTGMPRSGTSLMMQMLKAGGMDLFTDEQRTSDLNNPNGYYEHEVVKKIGLNNEWLKTCNGKAVKIVAPLITALPYNYKYKVIFMERNPYEIYQSQEQMLLRLGKKNKQQIFSQGLLNEIKETISKTKSWLDRHPGVEVIYLPYHSVLEAPLEQAIKVNEFLSNKLNPMPMLNVIDPSLHREKIISK